MSREHEHTLGRTFDLLRIMKKGSEARPHSMSIYLVSLGWVLWLNEQRNALPASEHHSPYMRMLAELEAKFSTLAREYKGIEGWNRMSDEARLTLTRQLCAALALYGPEAKSPLAKKRD